MMIIIPVNGLLKFNLSRTNTNSKFLERKEEEKKNIGNTRRSVYQPEFSEPYCYFYTERFRDVCSEALINLKKKNTHYLHKPFVCH